MNRPQRSGDRKRLGALLLMAGMALCACSAHQPRPVKQDALQTMRPAAVIESDKKSRPPGPPPFEEKVEPVTRGLHGTPRLFSLIFDAAPLSQVLQALNGEQGMNVIVDSEVDLSRPVTLVLNGVDFEEALDMAVAKGAGYAWRIEGDSLLIRRFEERIYHLDVLDLNGETDIEVGGDMMASSVEDSGVSGKFELKTKRNNETTDLWTSLEKALEGLKSAEGTLRLNRNAGIVYMIDTPARVAGMVRFLDSLAESLHRQVFIEAKIMEVQLNDDARYGIDWSSFDIDFISKSGNLPDQLGLTVNSGLVAKSGGAVLLPAPEGESGIPGALIRYNQPGISSVAAIIDFLRTQGDISVLSNPHLTVMNGQSSLMTVGYQFPYGDVDGVDRDIETGITTIGVEIRRAVLGLQLGITPQISRDGVVTLNIVPTITRIQSEENVELPLSSTAVQTISNPVIDLQGLATTVRVRDGDSIVLAGLITQVRNNRREGLPLLGDLPYLGALFQHGQDTTESRELVIVITPHLRNVP